MKKLFPYIISVACIICAVVMLYVGNYRSSIVSSGPCPIDTLYWKTLGSVNLPRNQHLKIYQAQDNFDSLRCRLYKDSSDNIGVEVTVPNELKPNSFDKDGRLAEHLKICDYGNKLEGRIEIVSSYDPIDSLGFSVWYTNTLACRAERTYFHKYFVFENNKIKFVEYYHPRYSSGDPSVFPFQNITANFHFSEWGYSEIVFCINHSDRNDCSVYFYPTTFHFECGYAKFMHLAGLFDSISESLYCVPNMSWVLLCDKTVDMLSRNDTTSLDIGYLNKFRIRYFPAYDTLHEIPAKHNKYRRNFYVDLIYNPKKQNFDLEYVKFDSIKHKNARVPLTL